MGKLVSDIIETKLVPSPVRITALMRDGAAEGLPLMLLLHG